jgi:hypothetical protein
MDRGDLDASTSPQDFFTYEQIVTKTSGSLTGRSS